MILGAALLATACWAVTFGWAGWNFWAKIGLSVVVVTLYSLLWQRPKISFRVHSLAIGLLSAAVLYALFFLGDRWAPLVLSGARSEVSGIYGLGEGTSRISIFFLLFFVTGPGEEIFWRGFLQDRLMEKWGKLPGLAAATALYGGVHLFSNNLMLLLAALVAGGFWGLLYLWKRDLTIQMVSHSVWSAVIFAVFPIQRPS